jgi:trimethylamine:corrinoid methyltransferase-like protein
MVWIKTVRLVVFATPLLFGASGQNRPAAPRSGTPQTQDPKVHDANWLKAQLRRRYGTGAIPGKSTSANPAKKTSSPEKTTTPPQQKD